jgi:tetratricopeptide (TPR) repeat protein
MVQRTSSQKTGTKGEQLVSYWLESSDWVVRKMHPDFGIDLEAELDRPLVSGKLVRVQVRTSDTLKWSGDQLRTKVNTSLLRYASECRVPVILMRVGLRPQEAYWVWLQDYVARNRLNPAETGHSFTTIRIHRRDGFNPTDERLRSIAMGTSPAHVALGLADVCVAAASSENWPLVESTIDLLGEIQAPYLPRSREVIQPLVELAIGGEPEAKTAKEMLRKIARVDAGAFTPEDLFRLIVPEPGYYTHSGVDLLATIHDAAPDVFAQMNLRQLERASPLLEYAIEILRANPTERSLSIIAFGNLIGRKIGIPRFVQNGVDFWDVKHDGRFSELLEWAQYLPSLAPANRAIERNPSSSDLYLRRGLVHRIRNEVKEAMSDFAEAIQLDRRNAYAYMQRGMLHLETKNRSRALADLCKAIELNNREAEFYMARAEIYAQTRQGTKALADGKQALALSKRGDQRKEAKDLLSELVARFEDSETEE